MANGWKYAVAGAAGGAVLAVALIFAAAATGFLPVQLTTASRDQAVHGYLMAHPNAIVEAMNALQSQQDNQDEQHRQAAVNKLGMSRFFNSKVAFITGPANAKMTLVEFYDYNCPYCRASAPAVKKFYAAHKNDARFAFIEFPIKGQDSTIAARAAIAARNQPDKYLAFHFLLMGEDGMATPEVVFADAQKAGLDVQKLTADMKNPSVDQAIDASHKLAQEVGIDGTPAFIINGQMREGAIDDALLAQMMKG
jgi:protein-disulfide isomerase